MPTWAVCVVCVHGCKEYLLSVVITNRLVLFFVLVLVLGILVCSTGVCESRTTSIGLEGIYV
ncbi:hypothetical protein BDV24DRAFT_141722 [Aspergillus arachidicola]|uniref:Uncharacterized protein n=1 Tax=Aspergillus arachidicola TaxID=656916 RepID=A0A5N6XTM9_9EURO|nr:hypothetical protein BDV24DRAFT_141722 [Aspergillus arachidicola]